MSKDFNKPEIWKGWQDEDMFGSGRYVIAWKDPETFIINAWQECDCFVPYKEYKELLTAYKELKHRMEGLEK